MDTLIQH